MLPGNSILTRNLNSSYFITNINVNPIVLFGVGTYQIHEIYWLFLKLIKMIPLKNIASDYTTKVINLLFPDDMNAIRQERLLQIERLKNVEDVAM